MSTLNLVREVPLLFDGEQGGFVDLFQIML